MSLESNTRFEKAYEMVSNTSVKFPPDVMLLFYAYYKRATEKNGFYIPPTTNGDLRSAFKINALLQVKDLSKREAEEKYVALAEKIIGDVPS